MAIEKKAITCALFGIFVLVLSIYSFKNDGDWGMLVVGCLTLAVTFWNTFGLFQKLARDEVAVYYGVCIGSQKTGSILRKKLFIIRCDDQVGGRFDYYIHQSIVGKLVPGATYRIYLNKIIPFDCPASFLAIEKTTTQMF